MSNCWGLNLSRLGLRLVAGRARQMRAHLRIHEVPDPRQIDLEEITGGKP